jgi:hypothetical protein
MFAHCEHGDCRVSREDTNVMSIRTTQPVETPSPLLLAIKEWQRQLLSKLK